MNVRDIASDIDDSSINKGYIDESSSRIKNSYIADNPSISVIIPLYNEEHSIKNVIERIPNHSSYEIIVVDDGSTDKSVKRIREIKDKDIKIIQHEKNQGYGASILTGFNHATGDIIVTMDSDGQHNPEEIPNLIKPIINHQADLVVGSRYLGSSSYKVLLYARVGEYFINLCLWFLYHQKVRNNQSGFRAFSSSSLKKLKFMRHVKFGLCTETLFNAASKNLRIKEIPVNVYTRKHGCSYVKLFHIIKSISLCIMFYALKKFRVIRFVPKPIYNKFYNSIIK